MSHPVEESTTARDPMPLLPLEPDERWKAVFADATLPAAVVELEAVRHNRQQVIDQLGDGATTIRVATRGIRSTSLLRHLLIHTLAQGRSHLRGRGRMLKERARQSPQSGYPPRMYL